MSDQIKEEPVLSDSEGPALTNEPSPYHPESSDESDEAKAELHRVNSGTSMDVLSIHLSREEREESKREHKVAFDELDWDGPDDPENPYNWSNLKKWYNTLSTAMILLVVSLGSSLYTSSIFELEVKFHISREVAIVGLTVYLIGLCCGPVIGAPLSEIFGRRIVYISTFPIAILFTMGYGLSNNTAALLVCRFFAGLFGSPAMAVAGGTILDQWRADMVGVTMTVFCLAPFLGPVIGPIIGGFAVQRYSWRWTAWIQLMFCGLVVVLLIFTEETYRPVLLRRRAKKRGIEVYEKKMKPMEFLVFILGFTITKPVSMLFSELIVLFLSIYVAFNFAILYAFFEAYPLIFMNVYGMSQGVGGLPFIGIGIGLLGGGLLFIAKDRWSFHHPKLDENGQRVPTQMKDLMIPAKIGAVLLPISMFWLGWTSKKSVHWMAPTAAGVFFGAPMILIFLSSLHYISASYPPQFSASALAANNLLRYTVAAVFPLFTIQMFEKMHIDWACSFFGFVAIALMPIPWVFTYYEDYIQTHSRSTRKALAIKAAEKAANEPKV